MLIGFVCRGLGTRHGAVLALLVVAQLAQLTPTLAQSGPPPVSVAQPVQREVTELDEFTGRFEAAEKVDVRARVSGYLESVDFIDGQRVEQGDLLYVIDPAPYEAAEARAKAAVTRAESQAALAGIDLRRAERAFQTNAVAREEVDTRRANLDVAQADVAAAEADLRAAELDLSFTRITAAVSGRVSNSEVDVGNLIAGGTSGATLLTTLVSTDPIHFVFDVNEGEYLNYIRVHGNTGPPSAENPIGPVFVKLLDETEWTRKGNIEFADNVFDGATGTLRLRATFANPEKLLLPGVFGRLRVAAGKPYEALLIDPKAVLADQSARIVMTVDKEGVVQPRPVELGPMIDGLQVVRSGLSPEDRLIVSGLLRARPGEPVTANEVPMTGDKQ
jgi:RND family efflux transporter MFP subunit